IEDVAVLSVKCEPHYVARPLSVFIDLAPHLLRCRGALGISPHSLTQLALLTKHIESATDRSQNQRQNATRSGELRLAIRDLVDAVTDETPLILAVEDAHQSDNE